MRRLSLGGVFNYLPKVLVLIGYGLWHELKIQLQCLDLTEFALLQKPVLPSKHSGGFPLVFTSMVPSAVRMPPFLLSRKS